MNPEILMPSVNIKSLSVPQLLAMRADIDNLLQSRKQELRAQLAEIGGEEGAAAKSTRRKGMKVAAKYRHPKTGETWSGRGGVAGWLAAEIKAGKKREEFLIDKAAGGKAKKVAKAK